jgi:hypothetical protein
VSTWAATESNWALGSLCIPIAFGSMELQVCHLNYLLFCAMSPLIKTKFLNNLSVSESVSEKYINQQFSQFGPITHVLIDRSRGHALVFYEQVDVEFNPITFSLITINILFLICFKCILLDTICTTGCERNARCYIPRTQASSGLCVSGMSRDVLRPYRKTICHYPYPI